MGGRAGGTAWQPQGRCDCPEPRRVLPLEVKGRAGVVARLFEGVTDHLEPLSSLHGDDETHIACVAPTSSNPQLASSPAQEFLHIIRKQAGALPDREGSTLSDMNQTHRPVSVIVVIAALHRLMESLLIKALCWGPTTTRPCKTAGEVRLRYA